MRREARGHRGRALQVRAREQDESVGMNDGRAASSSLIPSSRVHDEGRA